MGPHLSPCRPCSFGEVGAQRRCVCKCRVFAIRLTHSLTHCLNTFFLLSPFLPPPSLFPHSPSHFICMFSNYPPTGDHTVYHCALNYVHIQTAHILVATLLLDCSQQSNYHTNYTFTTLLQYIVHKHHYSKLPVPGTE